MKTSENILILPSNSVILQNDEMTVSEYDGKLVVMNCKIENEQLIIQKGDYSFIELTGVNISYRSYKRVICE